MVSPTAIKANHGNTNVIVGAARLRIDARWQRDCSRSGERRLEEGAAGESGGHGFGGWLIRSLNRLGVLRKGIGQLASISFAFMKQHAIFEGHAFACR